MQRNAGTATRAGTTNCARSKPPPLSSCKGDGSENPERSLPVPGMVYIVDDDDAVRDSLSMLLQINGVPALTYASGDAFLHDVSPDRNACLLIDMNMPGMTGLEVLAELQTRGITIPTIVMTGGLAAGMQAAAARTGATVLRKPFRAGELMAHVKEALGRDRA